MILVSSALGIIGRELIKILASKGTPVRGLVPSAGGAEHLYEWLSEELEDPTGAQHVEFVHGTFEDAASIRAAMQGIEAAIMILPSIMDEGLDAVDLQNEFVQAALDAGVQTLVNLSGSAAENEVETTLGHMLSAGEARVSTSGMRYTHLRFPMFMLMQNLRAYADMIRNTGTVFLPFGTRGFAMVDARDIAEVAAVVLTEPGHSGKTYTVTGPAAVSGSDVASTLQDVTGRSTQYVAIPPEIARQALLGMKVPISLVDDLLALYAEGVSQGTSQVSSVIADLTGQAPRNFAQFALDYAWAWDEAEGQLSGWNE